MSDEYGIFRKETEDLVRNHGKLLIRISELEKTVELLHLGLISEEKRNTNNTKRLEKRISELEKKYKQEERLGRGRRDEIHNKTIDNEEQIAELRNSYVEIEAYSDANKIHIAELREKVEGIYKSVHGIEPNDADTIWANLEINQNGIKRLNEQLNELKDANVVRHNECSGVYDDLLSLKEVLRDIIRDIICVFKLKDQDLDTFDQSLTKLDGPKDQTDFQTIKSGKWYKYINGKLELSEKLDSGGEKSGMGSVHAEYSNRSADDIGVIDSELPEPKSGEHFIMRDDNTPNNPILRALFFGGDDEYIIDWKFRYKRPYYEIVKREDLQWVIWNLVTDEWSLESEERLKRIKEEYNL